MGTGDEYATRSRLLDFTPAVENWISYAEQGGVAHIYTKDHGQTESQRSIRNIFKSQHQHVMHVFN